MPCRIIQISQQPRPSLPTIVGNVDYSILRKGLEEMDGVLLRNGAEPDFVQRSLDRWLEGNEAEPGAGGRQRL